MKHYLYLILAFGLISLPCGAQFLSSSQEAPMSKASAAEGEILRSLLHAEPPPLRFHAEDVISVHVFGVKDYDVKQRISDDGTVLLPFIGKVEAAGFTLQELELTIESLLKKGGIVQNPQVTISADAQPWAIVTVSGDVTKPGVFPAYGNLTLMDYLSEAGGLNEIASPNNSPASSVVTLVRPSLAEPVSIPLGPDPRNSPYARIPLFPGDEVRVGHTGVVYAVGAFKSQGAFPLKSSTPTTVLELVALAGGIGFEADRKDAHIIRTRGDERYVLDLDVSKILKGRMADVALQPNDILFVPTNNMKAAIKGGGAGVLVALASAYIYRY